MKPADLLGTWLAARLPESARAWLSKGIESCRTGIPDRELFLLMSVVSRNVGKAPLALADAELQVASGSRPGWDPRDWTMDQAVRVYLLCASTTDGAAMSERLDRLCAAGDMGELVAYYRGLPLYPDPPRYALRAAEGIRSNMRAVFEAVAHRNPYPAEQLNEPAWNQLVLKALFVGIPLNPIVGLDGRRNAALARMLCDYAHERWAASRPVSPELWRCVGPFAAGPVLDDFARLLERGTADEQRAAVLALREAADPGAARLLALHAQRTVNLDVSGLAWERLATAGN
ncbi:MAG TPA: EboA domain-containing protein [Casimicrobiaceae bacterium]|nr:EboA domain-containing protein [Casimicrobiaceae bacterium]